ncbi:MAG: putative TPR repeat methyltransferase [Granulosicoccus sp.]
MSFPEKDQGLNLLENAYELSNPTENSQYYDRLATDYDEAFAQGLGYVSPESIAEVFLSQSTEADYPIADIGCGTGLVAEALRIPVQCVDGLDISQKMLDASAAKKLYRSLYAVDLTGPLKHLPNDYGAVVSAGTFTHGHLGPEALANLLALARTGALFVIGVNVQHFKQLKFDQLLDGLESRNEISRVMSTDVGIYSKSGHTHSKDQARILSYRKLG